MSVSGELAIFGADRVNDLGLGFGAAYVFERDPSGRWHQVDKLTPADGEFRDRFGQVAISDRYAIVGATGDDDTGDESGSAYVFEHNQDGRWPQIDKITAFDGRAGDGFGNAISINDSYALIGAADVDDKGFRSGAAYVYDLSKRFNRAPMAQDDSAQTKQDTTLSGASVLGNDSDPDGDSLSVNPTPVSGPLNGTLTLKSDGSYAYTPKTGFVGKDSFTYRVSDIYAATDTAAVVISVTAALPPPQTQTQTQTQTKVYIFLSCRGRGSTGY